MRPRKQIETDGKRVDMLQLEVLLDLRDLLLPKEGIQIPIKGKKRGRPKKVK